MRLLWQSYGDKYWWRKRVVWFEWDDRSSNPLAPNARWRSSSSIQQTKINFFVSITLDLCSLSQSAWLVPDRSLCLFQTEACPCLSRHQCHSTIKSNAMTVSAREMAISLVIQLRGLVMVSWINQTVSDTVCFISYRASSHQSWPCHGHHKLTRSTTMNINFIYNDSTSDNTLHMELTIDLIDALDAECTQSKDIIQPFKTTSFNG